MCAQKFGMQEIHHSNKINNLINQRYLECKINCQKTIDLDQLTRIGYVRYSAQSEVWPLNCEITATADFQKLSNLVGVSAFAGADVTNQSLERRNMY